MDGFRAVQARMAFLNASIQRVSAQPAPVQLTTARASTGTVAGTSSADAFDQLLQGATQASQTTLTSDVEKTYTNGKLPDSALSSIGIGNHRLIGPAASAFKRMAAAAKADGVNIGVTDSYRTFAEQVDLARRKGLYSQGGLAARPGTSDHGWGKALDIDVDATGLAWMRQHAADYGFAEDTPREPWHWGYKG